MATKTDPRTGMTDREQAAMLAGFAAGMSAAKKKLPKSFAKELNQHARTAMEILQGGAFNPIDAWEFQAFMRDNFTDPC